MGAMLGLALGIAEPARATAFFVRTIGSDDNDGLTPETAFRSIGYGGRFLLNPGDRVVVGPGEYLEGNIAPRRGGASASPVAFVADTGGSLTGDPPGPVSVRPDGSPADQTTGFIVFGKQYVRIEGFTVIGAVDAGIQVRPSAQTGGASVDVEIVGNILRHGRIGVDVLGSARLRISNNEASDNEVGIALRGEMDAGSDITVSGNRLSDNTRGITATLLRGGRFEDNTIERSLRAITIAAGDGALVAGNTMRDSATAVFLDFAAGVTVVENSIDDCRRAIEGFAGESLSVSRNRMNRLTRAMLPSYASGAVTVEDNEVRDSHITEGIYAATFVLRRNLISSYGRVRVFASALAEITDNELHGGGGGMTIAAARVIVRGNRHFGGRNTSLQGDTVTLVGNDFQDAGAPISIRAAEAEASNNDVEGRGAGLWYLWRRETPGLARITANRVRFGKGILVKATSATDAIVDGNEVTGSVGAAIQVETQGSAEISGNQVSQPGGDGIHAQLDRSGSTALIQDNVVSGGNAAISLSGVRNALIQRNSVSASAGYGLLVRDGELVEIGSNQAVGTGGGINVAGDAILLGDCDRDGTVTASEVERGLHRLFDDDLGADCSALGPHPHAGASVASLLGGVIDYAADLSRRQPSGQVSIHDNTVETSGGAGVVAYALVRSTVARNTVRGSAETGISAAGGPQSEVILEGNTVESSGNDCILVSGGSTARLTDLDVDTCSESGIRIRDTYAVAVEGTHLRRAIEPAILATRTSSWTSRGNSVSDSGGGFALIGAAALSPDATAQPMVALVEEERVERVSGVGLLFARAARATAKDCYVASAAQHGVAARECGVVELTGNTLLEAGRSGVSIERAGQLGSREVILDGNVVSGFGQAAMDLHPTGTVLVTRNEIHATASSTGAGVFIGYGVGSRGVAAVSGNRIRAGMGDGVHVENPLSVFVWDNAVFSSAGSGVFVQAGDVTEVVNNLTYANLEHGIHLDRPGAARVFNNTSYANGERGLLVEGVLSMALLDNIFDGNRVGSVAVRGGDMTAINEGFNLTTGAYEGVAPAETDFFEDPQLVDPDGADDMLGGIGADDDDFRLRVQSVAIDAGAETAEYFGISGSATLDGMGDTGPVDLGFHYEASPRVP